MTEIQDYLINESVSAKEAMKTMDRVHSKILFVINIDNKLVGALSDGDIRRWIISENSLDVSVLQVCNRKPFYVYSGYLIAEIKKEMIIRNIQCIPVLSKEGFVLDLLFWDSVFGEKFSTAKRKALDIPVVIMAGGQGTRLDPITKIIPKALIPIGDRAIIELILDKFIGFGLNRFLISINHKSKIIKSFFEELEPKCEISFIEEDIPMGTIGGIRNLVHKIKGPIFITNCDILIEADYFDMFQFHQKSKFDLTLVGSLMNFKIPYGVLEIENGGLLKKINEKPEFSHLISTGMYILNAEILGMIPPKKVFHITDLITKMNLQKRRIGVYPISEDSWIDTGELDQYKHALNKMGIL